MAWFPRPAVLADLELLEPAGAWTPVRLLELFEDPRGVEWPHKVGVAGPVDGSAKPTTRLLAAQGWVLKTRLDEAAPSPALAKARLEAARLAGLRAAVWHPEKVWAVMRAGADWYPLTVCRELVTLRSLGAWNDRELAWVRMYQASLKVDREHRLGFDLNPANFGFELPGGRLYYLDDELYDAITECNLAGAIVSRIPEEAGAEPVVWRRFGRLLRQTLALGRLSWERLGEEVRLYPLSERFEPCREALLAALREREPAAARGGAHSALTCVLADVHANLPALEAVLDDARAQGADSFLFLGDAIGYGPHPAECVRVLAELPRAVLIRGNHDHAIATGHFDRGMNSLARQCADWTRASLSGPELEWLGALPLEHLEAGWLAVHGAPRDPHRFLAYVYELTYDDNLRYLRERRIPLCFYGHTHVQLSHVEFPAGPKKLPGPRRIELDPRHPTLVNPGSVGQPRDGDPRASYALWRRRTGELSTRRVAYDVERTVAASRRAALPPPLAARLRAGT